MLYFSISVFRVVLLSVYWTATVHAKCIGSLQSMPTVALQCQRVSCSIGILSPLIFLLYQRFFCFVWGFFWQSASIDATQFFIINPCVLVCQFVSCSIDDVLSSCCIILQSRPSR